MWQWQEDSGWMKCGGEGVLSGIALADQYTGPVGRTVMVHG